MRVVIIGLGSIGRRHASVLQAMDAKIKLYALRSRPENADEYENVKNFFKWEDISEISPDFIILSNPTAHHARSLKKLIPLGIPLFIEKPVLTNTEDADHLKKMIEAQELLTYVGCNLRFLDCLAFVEKQLSHNTKKLNEVNAYAGSYLPNWRPGRDFRKIYSANKEMGGGVHLDLIHEVDYLYWLFGQPMEKQFLLRSVSSLDITAVDYASYWLGYPDFTINLTLNYYRKTAKRQLELVFENDIWLVDLLNNQVINAEGEVIFKSQQSIASTYTAQMAYFLQAVKSPEVELPFSNTFADGVEVLKIATEA